MFYLHANRYKRICVEDNIQKDSKTFMELHSVAIRELSRYRISRLQHLHVGLHVGYRRLQKNVIIISVL